MSSKNKKSKHHKSKQNDDLSDNDKKIFDEVLTNNNIKASVLPQEIDKNIYSMLFIFYIYFFIFLG